MPEDCSTPQNKFKLTQEDICGACRGSEPGFLQLCVALALLAVCNRH
jgi:hypothetical protein